MSDGTATGAPRRQLSLQQQAVEQLRTLAKPYRLRVQADAEGFPFIPGRYGRIEWHCDGVNCHACHLPGRGALAVYSDRPRVFGKLWAIPGVRRHQTGDTEMRAVFPPDALEQVALVIKGLGLCGGRRARRPVCPRRLEPSRPRARRRGVEPRRVRLAPPQQRHAVSTAPPRRDEASRAAGAGLRTKDCPRGPAAPLATGHRPDPHATRGPAEGDRYRGRGRASLPLGDRSQTGPGASRRPRRTSRRRSGRAPSYPR